jgi:hypothetical protein
LLSYTSVHCHEVAQVIKGLERTLRSYERTLLSYTSVHCHEVAQVIKGLERTLRSYERTLRPTFGYPTF